ncbi:MAG: excinuclease ABC subunit UvrC [Patescibacteria group bacterium]|nr:excinuclease ABC subunit UvrC [Patescibacteria group bacterium]
MAMIPKAIKLKNNKLPDKPGVYLMKDAAGDILYIGKATSLKHRVESYFTRPRDNRIQEMVSKISSIDYLEQPTAIEALFLEASLIKRHQPYYNVLEKDDKSFSYLVITKEQYPRPFVLRATDFNDSSAAAYKAVYGPFKSSRAVRASLDIIRKAIPWSTCIPPTSQKLRGTSGQKRHCFYASLKQCPGVCVGDISPRDYAKVIRDLMAFFDGKRKDIVRRYRKEMQAASKAQKYELAGEIKNRLYALEHVQDVSMLSKDDPPSPQKGASSFEFRDSGLFGRIEGYDISNISGTSATGSMVVFKHGTPVKGLYRKFKIRTVLGPDDYASLREVLRRRFRHSEHGWEWPDLILIDGGVGQVNTALEVIASLDAARMIPVIGLAKGPNRDKDELVIPPAFVALKDSLEKHKDILVHVRDESHRFAIAYHRKLRSKLK